MEAYVFIGKFSLVKRIDEFMPLGVTLRGKRGFIFGVNYLIECDKQLFKGRKLQRMCVSSICWKAKINNNAFIPLRKDLLLFRE